MSFLNKLKKSVSDAGAIAKVTVEVNRLKLQVSSIKKDISELQTSIGKLIYEQYSADVDNMDKVKILCDQIKVKHDEIEEIQQKIVEVNGEKKCECGSTVPAETRFCSKCGHKFVDNDNTVTERQTDDLNLAPLAIAERSSTVEQHDESTIECKQCSEPIEEDAKFCEHCGSSTI